MKMFARRVSIGNAAFVVLTVLTDPSRRISPRSPVRRRYGLPLGTLLAVRLSRAPPGSAKQPCLAQIAGRLLSDAFTTSKKRRDMGGGTGDCAAVFSTSDDSHIFRRGNSPKPIPGPPATGGASRTTAWRISFLDAEPARIASSRTSNALGRVTATTPWRRFRTSASRRLR